jgi:adenosylmethionine-8-amino-7-oxononanoate aminotransferase
MSDHIGREKAYHYWNPYTPMDQLMTFLGFGPTVIVRGEGNYVFNRYGKRYLNANSSTWNFALGYGREEIIEAANRQMHELAYSNCWGMVHPRALELSTRLVEITSGNYAHVYLGANGSEVVESAIKMARQYFKQSPLPAERGRYKLVSLRGSYHGLGFGAISASGHDQYEEKFGPLLPGFVKIEPPYCYRCPYGKTSYPECELACAQGLRAAVEQEGPETVAGFLMEPIMGEMGVIVPPAAYYQAVGEICREYGLLFIVDEVTTGFGRTGVLFASQDWQIQPDLLCLGKIISGGYAPLSALLATETIYQRFLGPGRRFISGSTHSGHPVSAAIGLAAIDLILKEKMVENAARVGAYLKSGLLELQKRHEIIGDVRGQGLMLAVEVVKDRQTKERFSEDEIFNFIMDIVERGVLISLDGLRFFPPLTIDEKNADTILEVLDGALHTGFISEIDRKARLLRGFVVSKLSM